MPGVPRDTRRRIGLLGGSFNPAHEGHRHISLEALKRLALDEVWWVVSPQNPLKSGDGMEPLATRLARAKQVAHHPHIRVEAPELLLGTRYTMEEPFYRDRLSSLGVEVAIPGEVDRLRLQRMIYEELVRGVVNPQSKAALLQIVGAERARGADGVILGCTELDLLVGEDDFRVPSFNSTEIHARAGLEFALGDC